jgi:hypothetical protein
MNINISNFNFSRNSKVIKEIENYGNSLQDIPNIYYKKLGIKKKEINNISIDYLLDKLEDNKNQKKIIDYITNYKKIPPKTIDYFKNLKPIDIIQKKKIKSEKSKENNIENNSKITDNEIKQIIIDYLRIKYNELSIFNIDIYILYILKDGIKTV